MTEKKAPTKEELESARASNVKKTLESKFIQNAFGTNLVKSSPNQYGELGLEGANNLYESTMASDEASKIRNQLYQEKLEEGKKYGIAGEPSQPSNYDISLKLVKQLKEVMGIAKLSELEKAVKDAGAKLEFEVPKELKEYTQSELIQKAYDAETGEIKMDNLNETEKNALGMYQVLTGLYERAQALKAVQSGYFSELNAQGKKIADFYKPKEEKKTK